MLLQAGVTPTWVGPTVAVSLVIIAVAFVVIALGVALAARQASREMHHLSTVVDSLRTDLAPALTIVQDVSGEGRRIAGMVGDETEALVKASRTLREGIQERITNLAALYEVLEEEVEETALDVAVTLRTFRTGTSWFGMLRRLLRAGRRR